MTDFDTRAFNLALLIARARDNSKYTCNEIKRCYKPNAKENRHFEWGVYSSFVPFIFLLSLSLICFKSCFTKCRCPTFLFCFPMSLTDKTVNWTKCHFYVEQSGFS